jgi:hypothetical protein
MGAILYITLVRSNSALHRSDQPQCITQGLTLYSLTNDGLIRVQINPLEAVAFYSPVSHTNDGLIRVLSLHVQTTSLLLDLQAVAFLSPVSLMNNDLIRMKVTFFVLAL